MPMFISGFEFFWIFRKDKREQMNLFGNVEKEQPKQKKSRLDETVEDVANELVADAKKLKKSKDKVETIIEKLTNAKENSLNDLNNKM